MDLEKFIDLFNKLTTLQRAGLVFALTLLNIAITEKDDKGGK